MKDFQPFPWRYIKAVLDSRESLYKTSVEFTKDEFGDQATECPECGKAACELTWVPVSTADETWGRGEGRTGFVTCCMGCQTQIDFFVDEELTREEAELRSIGESSQELPWSESESVQ